MLDRNIRLRGLLKLLAGAAGFSVVFWFILTYGQRPGFGGIRGPVGPAIIAGLPGVLALGGLIELVTGVSIKEMAARWDSLTAWKRGLLGLFVVILALAATIGIFMLLAFNNVI